MAKDTAQDDDAARADDRGGQLLSRISDEMVRAQKKYFGKGPTKAKSYLFDDLLFIVMRGGLTTGEHTMVEFGQQDRVRDFRQSFENEMTERLTTMIEDLTGRKVVTYRSQILFDPDIVIEVFVFEDSVSKPDRDALDEPSTGGQ